MLRYAWLYDLGTEMFDEEADDLRLHFRCVCRKCKESGSGLMLIPNFLSTILFTVSGYLLLIVI